MYKKFVITNVLVEDEVLGASGDEAMLKDAQVDDELAAAGVNIHVKDK